MVIEIAKVPDGKPFDPHWTTYLQATATPVVAVIAAVIAASIQYRQWRTAHAAAETARNKLKLDLFERRLKVYDAAWKMISQLADPKHLKIEDFKTFLSDASTARWLFDQEVVDFLMQLQRDAQTALAAEYRFDGLSVAEEMQEGLDVLARLEGDARDRLKSLAALMSRYLKLNH